MRERAGAGFVSGAIATVALAALSYLGFKLGGLPFAPFDLFDWLARELPGWLVTAWIDSAVFTLRALHAGSTSAAAKDVEQATAILLFLAAGGAAGAAAFAALRISDEPAAILGGVLGAALGAGVLIVERQLERVGAGLEARSIWILLTFVAWGLALGVVHDRWRAASNSDGSYTDGRSQGRDDRSQGRRRFLLRLAQVAGVSSALAAACGAFVGRGRAALGARWSDAHALPNADASVAPVPGTRAELTPLERHYRVDIDTRPPRVDAEGWRLRISGLVERPIELTLDDLRREDPLDQFVTLECISNPLGGDLIGTTRWTGVSLQRLIGQRVNVQPSATHVKVRSADGFFEVVSLDAVRSDPRLMLAYAWDGVPLLAGHGFPLRVYIPNVYGMKQPKWVEELELVRQWEPGYWVLRGWDRDGIMKATSVVDVAARTNSGILAGGIAHAGARGISRVEVSVDGGAWQAASVREPLSATTWVVWRASVPAPSNARDVSVRCYDGLGTPQAPPFHARRVR